MKPGLRLYMIPKHGPLIITDCLPNNYQMVTMATEGTSTPALELSGAHGVKLPSWRAKPVSSVSQWPGSWLWDPLGPSPPQGEQVSVTVPSQLTVLNKIIAPTAGQKTRGNIYRERDVPERLPKVVAVLLGARKSENKTDQLESWHWPQKAMERLS